VSGQPGWEAQRLRFLVITAGLICLIPATRAQTADEIVAKSLAARGGVEKLKAVRGLRFTGSVSFGPGAEGPFVLELERPLKMHMEFTIQGQTLVRVYNGKGKGWVIYPFGENKDVQDMAAEDLRNISDESDFDGPLVDYAAKGNRIELQGKEDVDGSSAYRLKLTRQNGDVRSYLIDTATFLPVKWEDVRTADGKEYVVENHLRDYRDVSGLKFPFEMEAESAESERSQRISLTKVEINPRLDESRFSKPPSPGQSQDAKPKQP
jgi:outer membrane lipoprotein-sorting protein